MSPHIIHGINADDKAAAAALYWEAFGEKLGLVLGPRKKGLAFINRVLDPSHAISALDQHGALIGVVGFKTHKGALVGGEFSDLAAVFGFFSACWRVTFLALLDRDVENTRFLMDGIFVTKEARGKGVGKALLAAICAEAKARGYTAIRLDVIDTNPRARALYERVGFEAAKTAHLGLLHHIFGFRSATAMVKQL